MIRRMVLGMSGRLHASSRGSVAIMVAIMAVPMVGAVALATDASIWLLEQHRLQIAADAAAYAAALQLQNSSMQAGAPNSYVTLAANEAKAASAGSLVGTMATPVVSAVSSTSITVTLSSTADTYFVQVLGRGAATLQATAKAGLQQATPCALTLSPTAADALDLGGPNGAGSLTGTNCNVFSDSSSSSAIYVNSASISASSISAHGGFTKSNSGSNSVSPTPVTGVATVQDPVAAKYTLPAAGSCTYTNLTDTAYQSNPYALSPGTYCGTTTIGGNGSTDTFAPGTYIFTGNVVINNANVTQGSGVTFILEGATSSTAAGTFTWQNNSGATLTAPTSGAMSGLLLWQACPSNASAGSNVNGLIDFNGGSALTASGTIYAPCGTVQLDNDAQVKAASNANFSVVSSMLNIWQSASLQLASANSANGSSQVRLLQ